jgi:hypothetical protein
MHVYQHAAHLVLDSFADVSSRARWIIGLPDPAKIWGALRNMMRRLVRA